MEEECQGEIKLVAGLKGSSVVSGKEGIGSGQYKEPGFICGVALGDILPSQILYAALLSRTWPNFSIPPQVECNFPCGRIRPRGGSLRR